MTTPIYLFSDNDATDKFHIFWITVLFFTLDLGACIKEAILANI